VGSIPPGHRGDLMENIVDSSVAKKTNKKGRGRRGEKGEKRGHNLATFERKKLHSGKIENRLNRRENTEGKSG